MTVFIFTENAQKILGEAQNNVLGSLVVILASVAVLFYLAFIMISKKKRPIGKIASVGIVFLIFNINSLIDNTQRQQYLTNMYSELTAIYQNKEYKIVEGIVNVLHLEPEGGHDTGDIIKIDGVEFELSCFSGAIFEYNKTIVYGGVLTEGTFARVFYYQTENPSRRGKIILRIDLLEQATSPTIKLDPYLPCAG